MKSPRALVAAVLFLSALLVAALYEMVFGNGGSAVIHFIFALGAGLLSSAVSDFDTPRSATWLGRVSLGLLAGIFALQGVSDAVDNAYLQQVAYQGVGQRLEGWLASGFLLWCLVAVVIDSRGKLRIFGIVAVTLAAAVRVYGVMLSLQGSSLETAAPASLKLLFLMPFLWLLLESRGRVPSHHADSVT